MIAFFSLGTANCTIEIKQPFAIKLAYTRSAIIDANLYFVVFKISFENNTIPGDAEFDAIR